MATLNAYLVDEAAKGKLYPTVTPINATRILLNAYFGGDYPPLEDASYYAYKPAELPEAELVTAPCPLTP